MEINFSWPWLFAALPLPILVWYFFPKAPARSSAALQVPFYAAMQLQFTQQKKSSTKWLALLVSIIWILLIMAAARPQSLGETLHLPVSGRSLMLAVDISGSMQTKDMQIQHKTVTRLAAVKKVAGEFIHKRVGDRLGLILFGDEAYLQAPLTFDRHTINILLDEAEIGLAGTQTAIGDAIGLAVKRLRKEVAENRVLILLTDGANTVGSIEPLKAADLAANESIRIYTIGIGADTRLVKGLFGTQRIVNQEIDNETMQAIADKTGGKYYRARDSEGLKQIYQILDKIEPLSKDKQSYRLVHELYTWPLALAFILSLLIALIKHLPLLMRPQ